MCRGGRDCCVRGAQRLLRRGHPFGGELSSDGEPVTGRPRGRDPAGAERVQRHRGGNQPGVLRVQILNHTAELRTPVGARGRVPTEGSERPLLRPPGLRFVFCKVAACGSTFLQHLSFFGGDVPGSLSSAAGDPVVLLPCAGSLRVTDDDDDSHSHVTAYPEDSYTGHLYVTAFDACELGTVSLPLLFR